MKKTKQRSLIAILWALSTTVAFGQFDPGNYHAFARLDYYSDEAYGEMVVHIPGELAGRDVRIDLAFAHEFLVRQVPVRAGGISSIPFSLESFRQGDNEVTVSFYEDLKWVDSRKVKVVVQEARYNQVQVDRAGGGLLIYGMPFLPFGFYTYWPLEPSMLEQEAANGFNLVSPYWKIDKRGRKERMEFMDRCAELGMMVNFNLCSVAGGGGVSSARMTGMDEEEKMELLAEEINYFMDHPALLSWYIADEPWGQGVDPGFLEGVYMKIKEIDPWHPVTMVFMEPGKASKYKNATDIIMADPYPIPAGKVTDVVPVISVLADEFRYEKPVWAVPQAFGGNEWWTREPTAAELSAMTWLTLAEGATGIQYFIRNGPNGFPKSPATWGSAAKASLEVAELSAVFLFGIMESTGTDSPEVYTRAMMYRGELFILAVNGSADPVNPVIGSPELEHGMLVDVMFEGRQLKIEGDRFSDMIDGYGHRIYRVKIKEDIRQANFLNLLKDPGFEEDISPSIPSACYAKPGTDRGSTFFADTRVFLNGDRSLRLNTATEDEGVKLSFYNVMLEPGMTYTLGISAVTGPAPNNFKKKKKFLGPYYWESTAGEIEFELAAGNISSGNFIAGRSWVRHHISIDLSDSKRPVKVSPELELVSRGTAWFDEMRLVPDIWINTVVDSAEGNLLAELYSPLEDVDLYYQFFDITEPPAAPPTQEKYNGDPVLISGVGVLQVVAERDGKTAGRRNITLSAHEGLGKNVGYNTLFSPAYPGDNDMALVDGRTASTWYKNEYWQGFLGSDVEVVVDLGKVLNIKEIAMNFLNQPDVWIFLPRQVRITVSQDGYRWTDFDSKAVLTDDDAEQPSKYPVSLRNDGIDARYIKVVAESIKTCPQGHKGEGEKAWLFTDEIIIK